MRYVRIRLSTGTSSRDIHGREQPELVDVEAGPRVLAPQLTPRCSPYLREGVGPEVLRAYGGYSASSEDS